MKLEDLWDLVSCSQGQTLCIHEYHGALDPSVLKSFFFAHLSASKLFASSASSNITRLHTDPFENHTRLSISLLKHKIFPHKFITRPSIRIEVQGDIAAAPHTQHNHNFSASLSNLCVTLFDLIVKGRVWINLWSD